MILTSPPYWNMRDYGIEKQIGLEDNFNEYINELFTIFQECKRILRKDGTCWVNIRDTYSKGKIRCNGVNKKSLCMIPERLSIKMIEDGWLLRNNIIWYKPNAMPDSCKDRFTVDYEYLYFFTKNDKYQFNTQYEPFKSCISNNHNNTNKPSKKERELLDTGMVRHGGEGSTLNNPNKWSKLGKIKRCVWEINTKAFKEAHFATFPEKLIETPIKAGCPENGIILDPFMGGGTTGVVAKQLNKNYIGIELNPDYIQIANKRIYNN